MERNYGGGFGPRGNPPVQVGEELDVKIEAVGAKGDGIAKKDGFVLFVPNTNEGDTVRVKVTKVLNKVGFAEVTGSGSAPAAAEDAPAEEPAEEETFDTSKDSEDFGDEETEEAPAEEASEEKPAVEEGESEKEIVEEVEEKLDEDESKEEPAEEEPEEKKEKE